MIHGKYGRAPVAGACVLGPLGAACTSGSQCASGFCASGVCCNTSCTGSCVTCGSGYCQPQPNGMACPGGTCDFGVGH